MLQQLMIVYKEVEPDVWNAIVVQYPNILGYRIKGKALAVETMYLLISEELFYRTKTYNTWQISRESFTYLGAD